MIVAGIDIGSLTSKALILKDKQPISQSIIATEASSQGAADAAISMALAQCGMSLGDLAFVVGTGYGRINVPFAQRTVTEISCHAKGSNWLFPQVRTILDMGGQDCKAIRCDDKGRVTSFALNDKCAAGTGRYLDRVASVLELKQEEIGPLSLEPAEITFEVSDFCAVFAEREVVNFLRMGMQASDILAAASEAVVRRVGILLDRVGVEEALCISGGIAKNIGIVKRIEARLGLIASIAQEPQIAGALGAALFAADEVYSL